MASFFKSLLGIVNVEQQGDKISIGGIAAQSLARDIKLTWGTSRIVDHMFTKFGQRSIEFELFFAVEVHYMLQKLLKNKRNYTSRNTILKTIKLLEEETWLAKITHADDQPKILDRSKLSLFAKTPLPHQVDFFNAYEKGKSAYGLNGYLLAAGAGTGKTYMDLCIAEMVHSDFIVVVSPNNAVHRVWKKSIAGLDGEGCEFKKPQEVWIAGEDLPYKGQRYLVTHYEGLEKLIPVAKRLSGKITVILDESHNFNESKSVRTQLFVNLSKDTKSEDVIWASGTPIKALGREAIPLLKTIDPLFTPSVEERFKKIFGINAARALDILRNRIGLINFRVEKADVVDNKPSETDIHVKMPNGDEYTLDAIRAQMVAFVKEKTEYYRKNFKFYEQTYERCLEVYENNISDPQEKEHFKLYKKCVATVKKNPDPRYTGDQMKFANQFEKERIMPKLSLPDRKEFHAAKSVFKYVNLVVQGQALGSVLGKARSRLHVEMLQYVDFAAIMDQAEKKTIIFTSYVEVVEAADNLLKAQGFKPLLVYGATNKNLTANISSFEKDPNVNPLIATYPSLSTAVPLVMADQEILLNSPFREVELVQAKARIDRVGQDTPVKYVFVYLDTGKEPNISTRSKDILEWSRSQVRAIMGVDYSGETDEAMDGYIASMESMGSLPVSNQEIENALNELLEIAALESYQEGKESTFTSVDKTLIQ